MRKAALIATVVTGASLLSACSSGGLLGRARPDEFAVQRQAPLVVPPDFALSPPSPGAPRPQDAESSKQALEALFGGPAKRSEVESDTISRAGDAAPGIRSSVGDPQTNVVAKGDLIQTIIAAPQGDGQYAQAVVPG
ncbi:DUF3035 domain-containing protein [Novosphingobium sp. ZN18A2]|uniref:DUF3035 domain-containing protein n=1 Tax=Novosphingobium sp. ZN18A2 TaxID=3079861 RepID=UPI0030CB155B